MIYEKGDGRVLRLNWMILGIVAAVFLLLILICCIRIQHHRRAKCRVRRRSDEEKLSDINQALQPFGFAYDLRRDIIYSLKHAWQREFGYGKLYDEMAPVMNMVIHSEPIYFEYDNRRWMIEFWKGQYGITTGAEVGIYVEKERDDEKDPEDAFYQRIFLAGRADVGSFIDVPGFCDAGGIFGGMLLCGISAGRFSRVV